jgi:hypothetical protein
MWPALSAQSPTYSISSCPPESYAVSKTQPPQPPPANYRVPVHLSPDSAHAPQVVTPRAVWVDPRLTTLSPLSSKPGASNRPGGALAPVCPLFPRRPRRSPLARWSRQPAGRNRGLGFRVKGLGPVSGPGSQQGKAGAAACVAIQSKFSHHAQECSAQNTRVQGSKHSPSFPPVSRHSGEARHARKASTPPRPRRARGANQLALDQHLARNIFFECLGSHEMQGLGIGGG